MVLRIVYIGLIIVALVGIFGNISSPGDLGTTFQSLQTSITTVVYAGEIEEIRTAVDEFLVLRTIQGTQDGKVLAEKIDERLNNLELVKMYCEQEISILELSYEYNPYEKIQQICPKLKDLSFLKAVELFRLI